MPARFTIDASSAGKGSVEVIVLNPKGQREPVSEWLLYKTVSLTEK